MGHRWLIGVGALALLPLVGCAAARHVETSSEGGVVAIPANTNSWPFYHRDKALALIQQSAPEGYEIVMEQEAVSGVVKHTTTEERTKPAPALVFGGVEMNSNDPSGPEGPPTRLAALSVPLRDKQVNTTERVQETEMKEWRIHYRRRQNVAESAAPYDPTIIGG